MIDLDLVQVSAATHGGQAESTFCSPWVSFCGKMNNDQLTQQIISTTTTPPNNKSFVLPPWEVISA